VNEESMKKEKWMNIKWRKGEKEREIKGSKKRKRKWKKKRLINKNEKKEVKINENNKRNKQKMDEGEWN
jgi:hypothetical protein